mgnify:CR=1 FL=1
MDGLTTEVQVLFLNQFAHVDNGIAHTPQCRVDAYTGLLGYFFKTKATVVAKQHYFALLFGQMHDEFADITGDLVIDQFVLNGIVRKLL